MAVPSQYGSRIRLTFPFILPSDSLLASQAKAAPGSCTAPSLSHSSLPHSLSLPPFSPPSRSCPRCSRHVAVSLPHTGSNTNTIPAPKATNLGSSELGPDGETKRWLRPQARSSIQQHCTISLKTSPSDLVTKLAWPFAGLRQEAEIGTRMPGISIRRSIKESIKWSADRGVMFQFSGKDYISFGRI